MISEEERRDIKGYEGFYQVSNLGRVRSLDRFVPHGTGNGTRIVRERILSQSVFNGDYRSVMFSKNNKEKRIAVHILVASAFLGDRPENHEVNHINGICSDNNISNLEYCTHAQNMIHARETGLWKSYGSNTYNARLTEEKAKEALRLNKINKVSAARIAVMFGVSRGCVNNLICGYSWKHLNDYREELKRTLEVE